ncbi:hypothetical protein [Marichromatium gracile]|uniref:hypothetical protein n=1 Tax=Marichromatium gracile TaxID=1048 RepID=UPI0012902756|nr:hypothetical protein [Marichromatium gracile]
MGPDVVRQVLATAFAIEGGLLGDDVTIRVSGVCDDQNAMLMTELLLERLRWVSGRVLVDVRRLRGRPSLASVYFLMRELPLRQHPPREVAILEREALRAHAEFHRTTAANTGMCFMYFFDVDAARAWLFAGR